jgi:hypothetical protein
MPVPDRVRDDVSGIQRALSIESGSRLQFIPYFVRGRDDGHLVGKLPTS